MAGLFVPSARPFALGDAVFLLLRLLDDPNRIGVAGKVVWVTPPGAARRKPAAWGFNSTKRTAPCRAHQKLAGRLPERRPGNPYALTRFINPSRNAALPMRLSTCRAAVRLGRGPFS